MCKLDYREIEANGLKMRIIEKGDGPLILFCHGFPETSYAWRHQITALSRAGYHVVAPDLRGFGGTTAPKSIEDYAIQVLVGDMVAILDALEVETAVIVGNDWGATLAWQAALLRPDRFHAVVAIGVPMMGSPPVPPTQLFPANDNALFYTLYFQDPGVAEKEFERDVRDTLLKIYYTASGEAGPRLEGDETPNPFSMVSREQGLLATLPTLSAPPSWLSETDLDIFVKNFEKSGFQNPLNLYRNLDRNWKLQKTFSGCRINVPALYISGMQDPGLAIPGMKELIDSQITLVPELSDSIFIENCGHWVPQEKPKQVNKALLAFLSRVAK